MGSLASDHENLVIRQRVWMLYRYLPSVPSHPCSAPLCAVCMWTCTGLLQPPTFSWIWPVEAWGEIGRRKRQSWGISPPGSLSTKSCTGCVPWLKVIAPLKVECSPLLGPNTPFLYLSSWSLGWLQFVLVIYLSANNLPPKLNGLHTFICPGFCGGSNPSAH